jgi:hypothetical protein
MADTVQAAPLTANPELPSVVLTGLGYLKDSEEGFLRDIDATDAFHPLLAFLLFFQQLALAADVAAVAFGDDVLPDGRNCFPRHDLAADRGL